MKLSSQEEYGLRCLLRVGREGIEGSVTIPQLSRAEGITEPNVAKMMRVLRQGGFVQSTRGLNLNCNRTLKQVFKGAATTVIRQLPDAPLHRDYERMLANGTKPNLAAVTLARKIAATALAMWKHKEVYDPAKYAKPTS